MRSNYNSKSNHLFLMFVSLFTVPISRKPMRTLTTNLRDGAGIPSLRLTGLGHVTENLEFSQKSPCSGLWELFFPYVLDFVLHSSYLLPQLALLCPDVRERGWELWGRNLNFCFSHPPVDCIRLTWHPGTATYSKSADCQ